MQIMCQYCIFGVSTWKKCFYSKERSHSAAKLCGNTRVVAIHGRKQSNIAILQCSKKDAKKLHFF